MSSYSQNELRSGLHKSIDIILDGRGAEPGYWVYNPNPVIVNDEKYLAVQTSRNVFLTPYTDIVKPDGRIDPALYWEDMGFIHAPWAKEKPIIHYADPQEFVSLRIAAKEQHWHPAHPHDSPLKKYLTPMGWEGTITPTDLQKAYNLKMADMEYKNNPLTKEYRKRMSKNSDSINFEGYGITTELPEGALASVQLKEKILLQHYLYKQRMRAEAEFNGTSETIEDEATKMHEDGHLLIEPSLSSWAKISRYFGSDVAMERELEARIAKSLDEMIKEEQIHDLTPALAYKRNTYHKIKRLKELRDMSIHRRDNASQNYGMLRKLKHSLTDLVNPYKTSYSKNKNIAYLASKKSSISYESAYRGTYRMLLKEALAKGRTYSDAETYAKTETAKRMNKYSGKGKENYAKASGKEKGGKGKDGKGSSDRAKTKTSKSNAKSSSTGKK